MYIKNITWTQTSKGCYEVQSQCEWHHLAGESLKLSLSFWMRLQSPLQINGMLGSNHDIQSKYWGTIKCCGCVRWWRAAGLCEADSASSRFQIVEEEQLGCKHSCNVGGWTSDPIEKRPMTHTAECSVGSGELTQLEPRTHMHALTHWAAWLSFRLPAPQNRPKQHGWLEPSPVRPHVEQFQPLQSTKLKRKQGLRQKIKLFMLNPLVAILTQKLQIHITLSVNGCSARRRIFMWSKCLMCGNIDIRPCA